jgi:hypothetical protein
VKLSAQVSAAFERAPVLVKANVIDLLALEGTTSSPNRIGPLHQQGGFCDDQYVFPSWLPQIDDWSTIPSQHTAILG